MHAGWRCLRLGGQAVRFNLEIRGLDRLRQAVPTAASIGRELRPEIQRVLNQIRDRARAYAPKDTGQLRASITARMDTQPIPRFSVVKTDLMYAQAVHEGRRPGAAMPPPNALAGWASRHGFHGSLFVLARAIGRRGIRARPFMTRAFNDSRALVDRAARNVDRALQAQFSRFK